MSKRRKNAVLNGFCWQVVGFFVLWLAADITLWDTVRELFITLYVLNLAFMAGYSFDAARALLIEQEKR